MDPIKLQDIPEEDIFDYYICYNCFRIIREEDVYVLRNNIPVNGDSSILVECIECYHEELEVFEKQRRQRRIENMQYFLNRNKDRKIP